MIIALSKILPLFIYPIGAVFLLILISLFLYRYFKTQRVLLITSLMVIFLSGNRWVAVELVRSLEWRYVNQKDVPPAEVIVVLGGGTESLEYPRKFVEINSAGDRVVYAAHLYKLGKADHLLLSGGKINWGDEEQSKSPAEDMESLLYLLGVPPDAIWLETESRNTYENALNCKRILEEHGIKNVILVTSAIHMPRAVYIFNKMGIKVTPAPTDYSVTEATLFRLYEPSVVVQFMNIFPTVGNISMTTNAMKEYIGLTIYQLKEVFFN